MRLPRLENVWRRSYGWRACHACVYTMWPRTPVGCPLADTALYSGHMSLVEMAGLVTTSCRGSRGGKFAMLATFRSPKRPDDAPLLLVDWEYTRP